MFQLVKNQKSTTNKKNKNKKKIKKKNHRTPIHTCAYCFLYIWIKIPLTQPSCCILTESHLAPSFSIPTYHPMWQKHFCASLCLSWILKLFPSKVGIGFLQWSPAKPENNLISRFQRKLKSNHRLLQPPSRCNEICFINASVFNAQTCYIKAAWAREGFTD